MFSFSGGSTSAMNEHQQQQQQLRLVSSCVVVGNFFLEAKMSWLVSTFVRELIVLKLTKFTLKTANSALISNRGILVGQFNNRMHNSKYACSFCTLFNPHENNIGTHTFRTRQQPKCTYTNIHMHMYSSAPTR